MPQPRAAEESAALRQVGEPGVDHGQGAQRGEQTCLRGSGVGRYRGVLHYFPPLLSIAHLLLLSFSLSVSFSSPKDNHRLQKDNETLRKKLKEAEREVEILKTMLKRHALHPVEEDSSS